MAKSQMGQCLCVCVREVERDRKRQLERIECVWEFRGKLDSGLVRHGSSLGKKGEGG